MHAYIMMECMLIILYHVTTTEWDICIRMKPTNFDAIYKTPFRQGATFRNSVPIFSTVIHGIWNIILPGVYIVRQRKLPRHILSLQLPYKS